MTETDIVTDLRIKIQRTDRAYWSVGDDAADEIERLMAEINRLEKLLKGVGIDPVTGDYGNYN